MEVENDDGFIFTRITNRNKENKSNNKTPKKEFQYKTIKKNTSPKYVELFVKMPTNETPIISKNKKFRIQTRRSSLGLRANRASSFRSGEMGFPHKDILPKDYYKYISSELPEPVRMKHLIAWCIKYTIDNNVKFNKLNQVQDELLKRCIDNKLTTSWYQREEVPVHPTKPHPKNIENRKQLDLLKRNIKRLENEIEEWKIFTGANNSSIENLIKYDIDPQTVTSYSIDCLDTENLNKELNVIETKTEEFYYNIYKTTKKVFELQNSAEKKIDEIARVNETKIGCDYIELLSSLAERKSFPSTPKNK